MYLSKPIKSWRFSDTNSSTGQAAHCWVLQRILGENANRSIKEEEEGYLKMVMVDLDFKFEAVKSNSDFYQK